MQGKMRARRLMNDEDVRRKKIFTTGQVAELLQCCTRSVANWFDRGLLKGWKIPNSRERRFYRKDVLAFARKYEMNVPMSLTDSRFPCLAIGVEIASTTDLAITCVGSALDAGMQVATLKPVVAVIDLAIGRSASIELAARLQKEGVRCVIALANEDENDVKGLERVFTIVVKKPFDALKLISSVLGAVIDD